MKFNRLKILFFILAAASFTHGQITVHILNPWAKDSVRSKGPVYIQSNEPGWYPGTLMTPDFGNWLVYTFKNSTATANDRIELMSVIPSENDSYDKKQYYKGGPTQILIKDIFAGHESATDIWLIVSDTTKAPQVQFISPPFKVFRFFKPWEIGGAMLELKNGGSFKMAGTGDYCGWLTFKYFTDVKSLSVRFRNTLDNSLYGSGGSGDGGYIDLGTVFGTGDTAWILGSLAGAPSVGAVFPGKLGDCSPIRLASKLRDIGKTHPDFGTGACSSGKVAFPGMVLNRLGAGGTPVKTAAVNCITRFDWFEAQNLGNGYSNEKCYNLTLQKNDDGLYVYDTTEFFPLDSFQYLDAARTVPNPNGVIENGHNFSFTLETRAEFEYVKGQEFYFRGDDDVWVFIDSQLVVDLGGVHYPIEGSVDLDTLGLTPGKTYSFNLFFSERNCCGSSFRMVTSIALRTTSKIYYKDSVIASGTTKYDIYEKITTDNMACDAGLLPTDTIRATVEFYIEGPPFTTPVKLPSGSSYGGITVMPDYTGVIIDEPSIVGLPAGTYTIHYYSTKDRSMDGVFKFVVTEKPKFNNKVKSGACFSDNGTGAVDRAEIYFTDTLAKLPDSLLLSWPSITTNRIITSGITIDLVDKKHITVQLAVPFPPEVTTFDKNTLATGKCYFHDSANTTQPLISLPFSLADSVGPLIKSAVLIERIEPGNDTILLTFSEVLKSGTFTGKSLVLFKNGKKVILDILSTFQRGDTTVFVAADLKENAPGYSDSIALNASGPVADLYGNRAHPDNRPVPFTVYKIPGQAVSAWYLDRNADGLVETAIVTFNKKVGLSDFLATFTWKSGIKSAPLDSVRFSYGIDSTEIVVRLSGAFPGQSILTSGAMVVYVEPVGKPTGRVTPVADSAAPVLISAELNPGITYNGVKWPDTLVGVFSEPITGVQCPQPFLFTRTEGGSATDYRMSLSVLKNSGTKWSFIVKDILGIEFPASGDSVWINDTCGLSDTLSNKQLNHLNRRVALKVNPIPIVYSIKIGPNPLHVSDAGSGTQISVEPSLKMKQFVDFTVDITVYDKVGNIVAKTRLESRNSPTTTLSFVWNGCNKKGRAVGNGTYCAIVTVFDLLRNSRRTETFYIGVLR